MRQVQQFNDAMTEAAGLGALGASFLPAMSGCVDCGTATVIASPMPLGACRDCGAPLSVLSVEQISVMLAATGARKRIEPV